MGESGVLPVGVRGLCTLAASAMAADDDDAVRLDMIAARSAREEWAPSSLVRWTSSDDMNNVDSWQVDEDEVYCCEVEVTSITAPVLKP